MPVLDGWGFLAERNEAPAFRSIPEIVLSGLGDIDERVAAASVANVAKPVHTERLLRLLDPFRSGVRAAADPARSGTPV